MRHAIFFLRNFWPNKLLWQAENEKIINFIEKILNIQFGISEKFLFQKLVLHSDGVFFQRN